jgi:hypothetical protein
VTAPIGNRLGVRPGLNRRVFRCVVQDGFGDRSRDVAPA